VGLAEVKEVGCDEGFRVVGVDVVGLDVYPVSGWWNKLGLCEKKMNGQTKTTHRDSRVGLFVGLRVVGLLVVSFGVVGLRVVGFLVVGFGVVGIREVGFFVVGFDVLLWRFRDAFNFASSSPLVLAKMLLLLVAGG
jgi:hypothetical protein